MSSLTCIRLLFLFITVVTVPVTSASEWSVPLAGNAFRTQPTPGGSTIGADGALHLADAKEVYSVYFHVDRPSTLELAVQGRADSSDMSLHANVGDKHWAITLSDHPINSYPLGEIVVSRAGYIRLDLHAGSSADKAVAEITAVKVASETPELTLDYVRNNDGNMFYWGRRGPSVHLSYQLPSEKPITYAYSEITVPVGQDPIGSYFMANGFGEGYFGFQVNSETERRVLFSVWSPFHTDNPAEIPDEDRVVTLAKGKAVHAQDFGNEGSGGQSYLIYPWKSGATYRFLTEVKPDGEGATRYSSWFGDQDTGQWQLIASFRRPKTNKHLTGFHSFLESFAPTYGHIERSAHYGNQWVVDTDGVWHEVTQARFTGDATAHGRHRLD